MKLLFSSADLGELGRLVKRLVWARVPCAVCKDSINSHLAVWIQRDVDFPLALHVFTNSDAARRMPDWARALDPTLPAASTIDRPGALLVQPKGGTWPGMARTEALRHAAHSSRPAILASLQLFQTSAIGQVKLSSQEYQGSEESELLYEETAIGR